MFDIWGLNITGLILGFGIGFCAACEMARRGMIYGAVSSDDLDGVEADLDSAIEVAYKRGATEWVRMNYPLHYERLSSL